MLLLPKPIRAEQKPLPVIQGMPDSIYQMTPTPTSREECTDLIAKFKADIADIGYQLQIKTGNPDYSEWRRKALHVQRTKKRQVSLLKQWLRESLATDTERGKRIADELNGMSGGEANKVLREITWLRSCVGKLYDTLLTYDCLDSLPPTEGQVLEELSDKLNNRD